MTRPNSDVPLTPLYCTSVSLTGIQRWGYKLWREGSRRGKNDKRFMYVNVLQFINIVTVKRHYGAYYWKGSLTCFVLNYCIILKWFRRIFLFLYASLRDRCCDTQQGAAGGGHRSEISLSYIYCYHGPNYLTDIPSLISATGTNILIYSYHDCWQWLFQTCPPVRAVGPPTVLVTSFRLTSLPYVL